uniref:Uncharacterized protein n=1 Tax=Hydrogenovibrio crunogenus (strain DSM 25203 / XCL-2) TaxID=317025 RepID=Q31E50_HYDCU
MSLWMKGTFFALTAWAVMSITGCSKNVKIQVLEPAKIDRAAQTKQIAVSDFKDDTVGLAGKIEALLAKQTLDGQKYFTTISRDEMDRILDEQKLQYSGVVNDSKIVEAGEILGAQAFISGEVISASVKDNRHYEKRTKCVDDNCKTTRAYLVSCLSRTIDLSANIKMTDVSKADIIYADAYSKSYQWKHCQDDRNVLPSKSDGLARLANLVANEFVYQLTPHYTTMTVSLLDDPDLDYTSKQEKTLDVAIDYIEAGRLDKAEQLLGTLLTSTQNRSYVAAYNLGVVKEAQGELEDAKRLYLMADQLQQEPVDEINQAVVRIDRIMLNREKALSQISQ